MTSLSLGNSLSATRSAAITLSAKRVQWVSKTTEFRLIISEHRAAEPVFTADFSRFFAVIHQCDFRSAVFVGRPLCVIQ